MKEKTIYIANDGTRFETKADCVTYEKKGAEAVAQKDKMRAINAERQIQTDIKQNALNWIQFLKSNAFLKDYQLEPTIGNIVDCRANLSRIEAIYVRAKKQFFEDLNAPVVSLKDRVERIYHSAHVLSMTLDKRKEILDRYTKYKKEVASANKRLAELDKEEAELKKEKKDE